MAIKCIYCGSTTFIVEDGAYMCVECGSHQINFEELVDEEEAWDLNRKRFYINPTKNEKIREIDIDEINFSWSYYEAYNIILKQWTDILVEQMGASKKYQETVFKLWVLYLQKRNIAFKQDLTDDTPRGGEGLFDKRDVVALKGAEIENKKKVKEKKEAGSLEVVKEKIEKKKIKFHPNTDLSRSIVSQMNETLKAINENEELEICEASEEEDAEESVYGSTFLGESKFELTDEEDEDEESLSESEEESKKESAKLVFNMKYKKKLKISEDYKFKMTFLFLSPLYLTLQKLLSFLYLASMIAEENILMMDLLRWCREDFLPYQSAGYILSQKMLEEIDDENIFNKPVPQAAEMRFHSGAMAIFLTIQYLPLHSLELLINKMVDSLKLPEDMRDIGLLTMKCLMFKKSGTRSTPPVEIAAAASIILVFKVTFGMDNYHEERLSDFADIFNKIFKSQGSSFRVFSWRKWHLFINRTRNLISQVGLGLDVYCSEDPAKIPLDPDRLSRYFWCKGYWKTPIGKDNKANEDEWDINLLKSTLGLNLNSIRKVMDTRYKFKPYHLPYWGIVKQYLGEAFCEEEESYCNNYHKISKELDEVSFASHRFNWLLHRHEIIAEFKDFGKNIDIVKVPVESSEKTKNIITKLSDKMADTDMFYVPDPLKSFWKAEGVALKDCPSNFQWLVRVMSEICETSEGDIYKEYKKEEAKYLVSINTSGDKQMISFAEGENVMDL